MTFSGHIAAGWLIDGSGGPVRRQVMIRIEAGLIAAVESAEKSETDENLQINLSDATLVPGLVDAHVHLSLPEEKTSPISSAAADPLRTARSMLAERLGRYLKHGIVGVRDGGDKTGGVLCLRKSPDGYLRTSVTISAAGSAFYKKGRYGGFIGTAVADGNALAALVAQRAPMADHIKIINSGLNSLTQFGVETPSQFTAEQLTRAVAAAKGYNRPVMVHANGRGPVAAAIEAGCTSVEHGYFMGKENLQRMRDKRIIWVPTAIPMAAHAQRLAPQTVESDIVKKTLDDQLEQMALARRLGVLVAVGSDAGSPGVAHGTGLIQEMKLLKAAGIPIEEIIQCAAGNGARLVGAGMTGRLSPGMPATFIAAPGPPENLPESLMHIRCLYVEGEAIPLASAG